MRNTCSHIPMGIDKGGGGVTYVGGSFHGGK